MGIFAMLDGYKQELLSQYFNASTFVSSYSLLLEFFLQITAQTSAYKHCTCAHSFILSHEKYVVLMCSLLVQADG